MRKEGIELTNSTSLTIYAEVASVEFFDGLFDPAGKEKREVSISIKMRESNCTHSLP